MKKVVQIINNCYLCLKYPFLYPRNRFTGKHHTNWTLHEKYNKIISKQQSYANFHQKEYFEKYGKEALINIGVNIESNQWDDNTWKKARIKTGYIIKSLSLKDKFRVTCYNILIKIDEFFHIFPTYTELDNMPIGWRKAFGIQMCEEIKQSLLRQSKKALKSYRIVDIKEKYGQLRWEDNGNNNEIQKILFKYEYISERTCIICGKPATGYTPIEFWKSPYCDDCKPKKSRFFIDFGIDIPEGSSMSWYEISGNINYRKNYEDIKKSYKEYLNLKI